VGKVVPKEFESDMSTADIENFASEKMATLKVVTTAMAKKKQDMTEKFEKLLHKGNLSVS
jgi:hypothetical protein